MIRFAFVILTFLVPSAVLGNDLVGQVAAVCVAQNATPETIDAQDRPAYCRCEAEIWAKNGTESELRGAMTFMTGDERHMNGAPYSYDDALDFIVAQSDNVARACDVEY